MDLALYCPVYGYYEKEADIIGRQGDYYTSVSVGKLFGQLLACQFSLWADEAARGNIRPMQLVEAGADHGDLARDIIQWFKGYRPDLFETLEYWILEPSKVRRSWQEKTLSSANKTVRWAESFAELPQPGPQFRIVFSNELVDAFPVHRFAWSASHCTWFEWGVTLGERGFEWVPITLGIGEPSSANRKETSAPQTSRRLLHDQLAWLGSSSGYEHPLDRQELLSVLPDGFTIEISPAAERWWSEAARAVTAGKLLTIDYGHTFDRLLQPERAQGTLRAYRRHHMPQDILATPGLQDITADVNFTLLEQTGHAAGLRTTFFGSQGKFLTAVASEIWRNSCPFEEWTQDCTRQFQTLTHPSHLGSRFKVLVQTRGDFPMEPAVRS